NGRAVRSARRADPHPAAGGPAAAVEPGVQDHSVRHPRYRRSHCAGRSYAGPVAIADEHSRRISQSDPPSPRHSRHHHPSAVRSVLPEHQGGGAVTRQETMLDVAESVQVRWRHHVVTAGRIGLGLALLVAWKLGADTAGPLYAADPVAVFQRIVSDTVSGSLPRHIYVTLRISVMGIAIGCAFGVALPFLLRRLPRFTNAVEPYIMASVGVPKYALVPLFILWFGIDDAPKLWLVGLLVFYPIFIAVFAGIRNVDRRLISMARVVGASEVA